MRRILLVALIAALAGCVTPHEYVDPVDPSIVTLQQLHDHADVAEDHYQKYSQVAGIIWQPTRSDISLPNPDKYGSGGDSCLFTGHKFAADVYRYRVTGKTEDLDRALQSLRGLYILTHITGTPGVIARCAFPADQPEKWSYPTHWQSRIDRGFVGTSPTDVADPFTGGVFPQMIYYTRATKDQLTGLLHGLGVGWKYLQPVNAGDTAKIILARQNISDITEDVYNHLRAFDFKIRDENGRNDTNADGVDGLLKLQLLAVYKETVVFTNPGRSPRILDKYNAQFGSGFFTLEDLPIIYQFNNYSQYYAWNLRHLRGYTIYILEQDPIAQATIQEWFSKRLWVHVSGHLNAKFIFIYNAVTENGLKLEDAGFAMRSLYLKPLRDTGSPLAGDERKPSVFQVLIKDWDRFILAPHLRKSTSYSTWQKEPWDVGSGVPGEVYLGSATGLDYILPYWMARFYNLLE